MREILFRGKIKESKSKHEELNWAFGNFIRELETGKCFISDLSHFERDTKLSDVILEVDPETVCQYTGLTDKNGRKIFEGDILSAHLDDKHPEDITYVQITWDGFSWCMKESTEDDVMSEYDCNTFEVCGNIFDNPELIGE